MSPAEIAALARFVATASIAYHEANKELFLCEARRLARHLATTLALDDGTFDVRVNRAGIACSGEVVLHAEHLYVSLGAEIDFGQGRVFLFRGCRLRQDFTGLGNQWARWDDLATNCGGVLAALRQAMQAASAAPLSASA